MLLQILAVYDRFGRLIHGHPSVAKDVLEYVIFEKHLASLYGKWRLHAKIVPEWLSAYRSPRYGLQQRLLHFAFFFSLTEKLLNDHNRKDFLFF